MQITTQKTLSTRHVYSPDLVPGMHLPGWDQGEGWDQEVQTDKEAQVAADGLAKLEADLFPPGLNHRASTYAMFGCTLQ